MKPLPRHLRSGQSLVEFALVALVMYMLLAAILTFGHMLYVAQGLQSAADLASREMSRTPFHAINPDDPTNALTFEDVVTLNPGSADNDKFRELIFDEAYLIINLDEFYSSPMVPVDPQLQRNIFIDLIPTLPLLNQQLVPLMITERIFNNSGDPVTVLRYPGAVLDRPAPIEPPADEPYPSYVMREFAIGIPLVVARTPGIPGGVETIRWIPIIEEIDTEENATDNTGLNADPFAVDSAQRGIVALRINYPFQSASMSGFRRPVFVPIQPPPVPGAQTLVFEPTVGSPNTAVDALVSSTNTPSPNVVRPPELTPLLTNSNGTLTYTSTYGGQYGLGAQGAMGSQALTGGRPVRPYRRIISAQAIYRREIFE